MAKIYAHPKHIKYEFNWETWKEDEEKFEKELRAFCKQHGSGSYAGEIVKIPHADSHAQYMVLSLKPAQLIHMPVMDAWDSPYAELMTAKSIKQHVDADKRMKELFSKRS